MSLQNNFRIYLSIFLSLLITNANVSAKPHGHSHILLTGEEWGKWNKCPADSFVTGISLKLHVDSDISTITGVRLFCTRQHVLSEGRKDFIDTILQVDPEGQTSHWVKPVFCENGVGTEFKVKHADLNGHKTVTNLRLICSDGEILKIHGHGIGKDHDGVWTDGLKCSPRHAICGLETQVFPSNGNNIFTDARVHCCDVENPAIKCTPSERWQLVTECENSEAIVPKTCGFEKKVGTSYAGKEKETSIYENLGFTLNGVSTDLSSKREFQAGVVSDATNYEWSTAGHETWMPETKADDTIQAPPGHKSSVYQVVGHCGFYRIRSSQFKIESSLVTKSEHSKDEHKHKHSHVGKHHEHHKHTSDDHDPNIQSDFGGDDSWESDNWDDEEQVDETGKHEPEPIKPEPVQEHKEEKKSEEKTSNDSFGDEWDESSEEKVSNHVVIPVVEEMVKPNVEEKKDSNESADVWASSEEAKPETKDETPTHVAPKADSTEKKDDSPASPVVVPETHAKPEEKVHNSFEDDDWSSPESEEDKSVVKVDQPAPVAPKVEDAKEAAEKKESAEHVDNEWDSSEEKQPETKHDDVPPVAPSSSSHVEETKTLAGKKEDSSEETKPEVKYDDAAPIAPTSDSKVEEAKVSAKDSEEDFSEDDWAHSEEKKSEDKEEVTETKVNNLPLHEPISTDSKTAEKQAADDSFSDDWDDSEEKTHEAKVIHANEEHSEHKPEVKKETVEDKKKEPEDSKKSEVVKAEEAKIDSKQPLPHDDDMELMAKDTPSDEWASSEESEEVKPQEKVPNNPVPPQQDQAHHEHHDHHGDAEIHHQGNVPAHKKENIQMPETAAQVSDADDYWDDDDFVVEIPETRFDKMEKQEEHEEPEDHSDTESLKFPDFKNTFDAAGEKIQDTVSPLTDQIVSAIDDIGQAVQDAKDSPIVKDIQQTLSEVMEAAINSPHDDQQAHQDDEVIPKVEDATQGLFSNETSEGEPQKAQSAILGYIVGGMVAGVVIIVIVIFVLEKRQPKKPDETDKEGGGVRDQPLLGGYKKDVALAVGSDKDSF